MVAIKKPNSTRSIVVTNRIHNEVLARLSKYGQVEMNQRHEPWNLAELSERLRNADAMMGFMTDRVDDVLLEQSPGLRIVACALKGFDSYDVAACTRRGIWISNVPDLLTAPTAELAIGLAISLARHVRHGDAYIRAKRFHGWRPHLYGTGLAGSTVAVVGMGKVGKAIIDRLAGFGCKRIIGVDPESIDARVMPTSLDEAMSLADYLFIAVPLLPESRHLLNDDRLSLAKPGQLIINVGRGSVVSEQAIVGALRAGRIGGYAADVFEFEDWLLVDRPLTVHPGLLDEPNTLFTPHLGSAVTAARLAIEHRAADNIIDVFEGRQPIDALNLRVNARAA